MGSGIIMVVLVVAMVAMMWWQSRQQKKQQTKTKDFRESLQPGTEVATFSGLLGTIESVDLDKDQVVINSEGNLSRWRIQAITEPPIVPAYVSDDEVDELGNPLPATDNTEAGNDSTDSTEESVVSVPAEVTEISSTSSEQSGDLAEAGDQVDFQSQNR